MANKNPLRICFLLTALNDGGVETVVVDLAVNLKRRGWQVGLITLLKPREQIEKLRANGIELASLHMHRGIADPRAIFRLARILKKWQPHLVHSHSVHANLLGRIVRLVTKIPVLVSTAHNITEGARWREVAYRITDSLADITTNVSKAAVERYIRIKAAPANKIRFVPNGLDIGLFRPDTLMRNELRDNLRIKDKFVWLAAGRLDIAKDYPNMLNAFARLDELEKNILLIAGMGPQYDQLVQLSHDLWIDKYVWFLGLRRDMPRLLNAADAFVMSSAWEGMPKVLLEAAATELPIVATDVGGNREVIVAGKSGYLVPPENPVALHSAMNRIVSMAQGERSDMGRNGRKFIVENYAIDHIVDIWENLYHELLTDNHCLQYT